MQLHGVLFTDRNEETVSHSAHMTIDAAAEVGATLAREIWTEYQSADGTAEPFPDVNDNWEAMDALRTRYPVRLEVDEITIEDDTLRAAFLSVGNRSDVIAEAIGDAYAYRTNSGELTEDDLEDADPDDDDLHAARRFRQLADELGMRVSPIHFS
jgi:hypothetical protein